MDCTLYEIHNLLNQLGVTANYAGFFHMSCAVALCVERPERLTLVTKQLYPEVAHYCHTSPKSVERNLRTVSEIIWRENRPLLEKLARRPLAKRPRSAQLLAILCACFDGSVPRQAADTAAALAGDNNTL